ncbi:MAG: hypothetical protein RLZZ612_743 [Pseudomonadota bacterium]
MSSDADIEIFVASTCAMSTLLAWITAMVGTLGPPLHGGGQVHIYWSSSGPVVVTAGVEEGRYTSVWFHTDTSPWATPLECALQAAQDLGCWVEAGV